MALRQYHFTASVIGGCSVVQFTDGTPADVVVLFGCEVLCRRNFWPRPVYQADVLVRFVDAMDVEKARRDEPARAGRSRGRTFASSSTSRPLSSFASRNAALLRVFIQLDVPAERQPFVELAMMDEHNFSVVNDENRDGEINFFVDMGH